MANIISGSFAYAKVTEPVKKYESEDKEFTIDVVVDKATAKSWNKSFPKQKSKVVDTADFEQIYKFPAPYPDEDEQYIIKLKKPAQYKDGTELPKQYWPKLLQKVNGKAVPIPEGVLIANNSKGQVSYETTENSYGTFARLKAILVEELIEYKKAGADAAADFGLESDYGADEFAQPQKVVQEEPKKENKPTSKKVKPVVDEEFDDSMSPF